MGFCNRCGDIVHSHKCQKCGGKSVDSLAKGAVDSSKVLALDRWQNQYGNSLLTESSFPIDANYDSNPVMKRQFLSSYTSSPRTPSPISINSPKSMVAPIFQQHLPTSTKKRNCRKCMQHLRGPRVSVPAMNGDTWYYHYDCLTCTACGDVFTDSEFVGDGESVFHMHCSPPPPPLSPTSTMSSSDSVPAMMEDIYRPTTTRCMPKLGGSKICPGCNASIAVMEETPGPRASRWHKKCLKCTGCKKQLDSGAKAVVEHQGRWWVRCSDCSDRHQRSSYFR